MNRQTNSNLCHYLNSQSIEIKPKKHKSLVYYKDNISSTVKDKWFAQIGSHLEKNKVRSILHITLKDISLKNKSSKKWHTW